MAEQNNLTDNLVCHVTFDGDIYHQLADYLNEGGGEWTAEDVANIVGLYDTNAKTNEESPLIPDDVYTLNDEQKRQYGEVISIYNREIAKRQKAEMADAINHPARSFAKIYEIDGWNAATRSNRISMIAIKFSEIVTRRKNALAEKGIPVTREEICNGHLIDGKKMDGQFSIFSELFDFFYNEYKDAWKDVTDWEKALEEGTVLTEMTEEDYLAAKYEMQEYANILNNWSALCVFARMRIRDMEGIKLGHNLDYATAADEDDFNWQSIEETYTLEESIRESWMQHSNEVSAFGSLGKEIRQFLATVPMTDDNGERVYDDLGYPLFHDPIRTHQLLADVLRGYTSETDMCNRLQKSFDSQYGMRAIQDVCEHLLIVADVPEVNVLDDDNNVIYDTDNNPLTTRAFPKEGFTGGDNTCGNPRIITQLLLDMHKNFVGYTAMLEGDDGRGYYIKDLNREQENPDHDVYLEKVTLGVDASPNTIYDENGNVDYAKYSRWQKEMDEMTPPKKKDDNKAVTTNTSNIFETTAVYGDDDEKGFWNKSLTVGDRIKFLHRALTGLGIDISEDDLATIYGNAQRRSKLLNNLWEIGEKMREGMDKLDVSNKQAEIDSLYEQAKQAEGEEKSKLIESANKLKTPFRSAVSWTYANNPNKPVVQERLFNILDVKRTGVDTLRVERRVSAYDRKGKSNSRYSDVTPSYMGDFVDKIHGFINTNNGEGLRKFLMEKYGKDAFFYNQDTGKFYNKWLQELYDSSMDIDKNGNISEKCFAALFGYTNFLYGKIDDRPVIFENFSSRAHAISMIKNFVQKRDVRKNNPSYEYADYPCFILGDAGVQMYFTAKRYSQQDIVKGLEDVYKQELVRMRQVAELRKSLSDKGVADNKMPEGYVSAEHVFTTLMFLNPDFEGGVYWRKAVGEETSAKVSNADLANNELREQNIQKLIDAIDSKPSLLTDAINAYMEDTLTKFKDRLCTYGILQKDINGKYIEVHERGKAETLFGNNAKNLYDGDVEALINDFFWNTKFATIQQIQMFTVDTAFYDPKMTVKDLQKRYKEIYAPGKGVSVEARGRDGNLYAQKSSETVIYIDDISESSQWNKEFDEALRTAYRENSPIYKKYKKGSSLTDGQAWRTLDSYRAVMGMSGEWSDAMEDAYLEIKKIRSAIKSRPSHSITSEETKRLTDLMVLMQPRKPYLFTHEQVDLGNGRVCSIPVQHKYAEIIVIPELLPKGKLRDMAEYMDEKGIDMIASTKCVKVGGFGSTKIDNAVDSASMWEALEKGYRHELSYSDYRIQNGVPAHLDQAQLFGTQIRKLVFSGIKQNGEYGHYLRNILRNHKGNEELTIRIPGAPTEGEMVTLNGKNLISLYNVLIMANQFDSYEQLERYASTKQDISNMVTQNSIANSTQVDDVINGFSIIEDGVPGAGDFQMPIGEPMSEHDTTALLLSCLQKGVNKQKILGGSCVQASAFGVTPDNPEKAYKEESSSLREVCSKNDKGEYNNVLYEEVEVTFARSYTDPTGKEIPLEFSDWCFTDNEGHHNIGDLLPSNVEVKKDDPEWEEYQSYTYKFIDGKWEPCAHDAEGAKVFKPLIEVSFPGILDMVAYRIPTERLYSAINCKIKRFSHPKLGGIIRVPVSGTTKAGFDFDIDKLYFFMKEFTQEHFTEDAVSDIWRDIYGLDKDGHRIDTEYPGLYDALKKAQKEAEREAARRKNVLGGNVKISGNPEKVAELTGAANEAVNGVKHLDGKMAVVSYWKDAKIGNVPLEEIYGTPSELFRKYIENHGDLYAKHKAFDEYDPTKSPFNPVKGEDGKVVKDGNSRVARNNMLIGIIRERLKDEETFKERYTPGGFDKLSDAALEMRIIQYSNPADITTGGIIDYGKVRELAKKIRDKEDPTKDPEPEYDYSDPSTILIYNQQNQIAAKLIGIFANQNTHHVLCSTLNELRLRKPIAFGEHIDGLSDFLHKGEGQENLKAEIDVNVAELLAAAVDAVKDPVLNYLNLNLTTANSAAVLFRLGYSQREVGLLFNQPIIKEICEYVANNGCSTKTAINEVARKYESSGTNWRKIQYKPSRTTTDNLGKNLLLGRQLSEGKSIGSAEAQYRQDQLQVLKLFNQIQGVASEMNSFVQATRFTAANSIGSTWGDVIAVLQRTEKFAQNTTYVYGKQLDKTKNENDEEDESLLVITPKEIKPGEINRVIYTDEELLKMSPEEYAAANYGNPLGFEQCMMDIVRRAKKLFGQYYPYFTNLYENIRGRLAALTDYGTLDADTINSIHRDLVVYLLGLQTGSNFDGEMLIRGEGIDTEKLGEDGNLAARLSSSESVTKNRKFFIEEYPAIMRSIIVSDFSKAEGERLRDRFPFFARLEPRSNKKGNEWVQIMGVGGMQGITANEFVESWTDAFKSDEKVTVEGKEYAISDLALGLFYHNFYRLGFNFNPTSTIHLTPNILKVMLTLPDGTSYAQFINMLIENDKEDKEGEKRRKISLSDEQLDAFVRQYILNHLDNYKFVFRPKAGTEAHNLVKEKMKSGEGFELTYDDLKKKNLTNLFTVKVTSTMIHYKPIIAIKENGETRYYMAQTNNSKQFNVTPLTQSRVKYIPVDPQGTKGSSLDYRTKKNFESYQDINLVSFLEQVRRFFTISADGLRQQIKHMQGMGIKVHTLREMEIFVEQHPELFDDALFLTAYHASAADFDRFDLSFIRNGETGAGDAVFGRGVYVGSEEVARGYGEQSFKWKNARRKKVQRTVDTRFGQVNILTSNNNVNAGTVRLKALWSNSGNTDIYLVYYSGRRCFITVPVIVNKETVNVPLEYDPILFNEFEEVDKFGFKWENGKLVYEDQVWDLDSKSFKVISKTPVKLAVTEAENGQPVTFESLKGFLQDIYDNLPTLTKQELEYLRPSYNLYTTTIPNDTGSNYLSWDEQLSQEIINTIIHGISNEVLNKLGYVGESPQQWLSEYTGEMLYHDLVKYYIKRGMSLDEAEIATNELLYSVGIVGNKVSVNYGHQHKTKSEKNYVLFHEDDVQINSKDVQYLRTDSGEVYGFAYQGEIYIDETKLDPQAPVHEYTHIWDEAVMLTNPRLWERGKRLLRDSRNSVLRNLWNEIAESDAYGKKWLAQGKTEEQIENLIAGEVHARLVGEKGAELLEQIERNTGGRGLVARLKRWMKDVFRHIGKTFGTWTDEALNELSLNDFINMSLRDFVDGVNPNNYKYSGISSDISAEMEQIRQNAIADGTFMKAPNGKKSNLTERQWLQVRTKAFKDWFGDWENDPENSSKVVDENGEPLVVYHGTLNEFTTFHEGVTKWYGKTGIFFSSDKDYAESMSVAKWIGKYANMWEPLRKELNPSEELYTMPVFLNIKNPAKIDSLNHRTVGEYRLKLDANSSIDGVIGHDYYDPDGDLPKSKGVEYAVFDPNQIKSATDNNGEFSTDNNDINFMVESDSEDTGSYQSEFNTDEITYEDENADDHTLRNMYTQEEWDFMYDELLERNPAMRRMSEEGLFSRDDLMLMFTAPERSNEVIREEIRRGLLDGSIKPMTIDEEKNDVPVCM